MQVTTEAYLWIAVIGIVMLILILAFAWVLSRRRFTWVESAYERCNERLTIDPPYMSETSFQWTKCVARDAGWTVVAWMGFLLILMVFITMAEWGIGVEPLVEADRAIHDVAGGTLDDNAIYLFRAVTRLADVLVVAGISLLLGLLLWWKGYWWEFWALGTTVVGGMAVVWSMKELFGRDRPEGGLIGTAGQSFPSGHASLSMLFYGFMIYITWRLVQSATLRAVFATLMVAIILSVSLSRILLSVHWLSDVIGGLIIGLGWLLFSLAVTRFLREASAQPVHPRRA